MLRTAPGQPKRERKHHDTTGNMIAASSHVLLFYRSNAYPYGYMAVGYLLFLQEQIKDHHHLVPIHFFVTKIRSQEKGPAEAAGAASANERALHRSAVLELSVGFFHKLASCEWW